MDMGMLEGLVTGDTNSLISGITTGVVKENWNKDYPGMIKVEMFLGEKGKNVTGWIPVMTGYGGKDHGMYTLPEVGSEVVIAFNMGDRNCPIVLGSLWNKKNTMPKDSAKEKNTIKRFKTKGGHEVTFSDEEKKTKITVTTSKKLKIEMDDEKKTITIQDEKAKNAIVMNMEKGDIAIKADKAIHLNVGGKDVVTIQADGGGKVAVKAGSITQEGSQKVQIKGQNTKIEGGMVGISASSQLKAESSGIATLKGAMVKIN